MPSDDNIRAAVKTALANRGQPANQDERDALFQLVRGRLRLEFNRVPLDSAAQTAVDWFIDGRRDMPPELHRPQLRDLVGSAWRSLVSQLPPPLPPPPPPALTEVLVNVAIGQMADHMPPIPMARSVIMQNLTCLYLAGS